MPTLLGQPLRDQQQPTGGGLSRDWHQFHLCPAALVVTVSRVVARADTWVTDYHHLQHVSHWP